MIITKKQAQQRKLKHFFTNVPCTRGHIANRYVSTTQCTACQNMHANNRYHSILKHDPKYRKQALKRAIKQHQRCGTAWYHSNKQKAAELNQRWIKTNQKAFKQYCKNWRRKNLDKLTKNAASYRAQKLQATPTWANKRKIQNFYTKAQKLTIQTGIVHTVDHIVPLNSKKVCGLHWEGNLQILTLSKNSSKKNLYWKDQ